MRAVAPRTGAPECTLAEEQEEYLPITVARYSFSDSPALGLLTRWKPNEDERKRLAAGEDIYVMQCTGGQMTPMMVQVGPGEFTVEKPNNA